MKKILLCFASAIFMLSCSKEDSLDILDSEKEIKTVTPNVGYISPYDLNNVNPTFPIKFINNTVHQIDYRLATMAGFFDGNWNGVIDYTPVGGPLLTPTNAPILLAGGSEFAIEPWAQSISSPPNSVMTININSLAFNGKPYNSNEINFLRKYSKLLHVHATTMGSNMMLKHDVPPPFTNMNSLPPIMAANNYAVVPGVPAYNMPLAQPMGISVFHTSSREFIWPDMPNYRSEYFFTGPGGTTLHLYFKTYPHHIEIVLE